MIDIDQKNIEVELMGTKLLLSIRAIAKMYGTRVRYIYQRMEYKETIDGSFITLIEANYKDFSLIELLNPSKY